VTLQYHKTGIYSSLHSCCLSCILDKILS